MANNVDVTLGAERAREHGVSEVEGTSMGEAIGGAGAVVLGILGLIGIKTEMLSSIASIAIGVAFMVGGASVAMQYARSLATVDISRSRHSTRGAVGMEMLAGIAGVVLGILALLRIDPLTLLSVGTIVLGAGMLMSGAALSTLESASDYEITPRTEELVPIPSMVGGSDVLVGLGAIILGILALLGNSPLTLTAVAFLSLGASVLLSGSWLTARIFRIFG